MIPIRRHTLSFLFATVLALCALSCGGDDPVAPGGGGTPTTTRVDGVWNTTSLDSDGTPSSRYFVSVDADSVHGYAYFRWQGTMEHVGDFTGTLGANNTVDWVTTMDDNGWEGTERITGTFSGTSFSGTFVIRTQGGTIIEQGGFQMKREKDPEPFPAGTGVLGNAGPWYGGIFYSSIGPCNGKGYICTIVFQETGPFSENGSVVGVNVLGNVSARTWTGGPLPKHLSGFLGPVSATVTGTRKDTGEVEFTLSGGLNGVYIGDMGPIPAGGTNISGFFDGGKTCTLSGDSANDGVFTLTGGDITP